MMEMILIAFGVYWVTLILVSSKVLLRVRKLFKRLTPFLVIEGKHFIDCRFCVGFWVALLGALLAGCPENFLYIGGMSYFLVTQETPERR